MLYIIRETIPANTPVTSPVEKTITLTAGVITSIGYHFPAGCHALASVTLWKGHRQLIPENRAEQVRGDNVTFFTAEFIETAPAPYEFIIKLANEDDTWPHTPIVYLIVMPKWVAAPMIIMEKILSVLSERLVVRLLR